MIISFNLLEFDENNLSDIGAYHIIEKLGREKTYKADIIFVMDFNSKLIKILKDKNRLEGLFTFEYGQQHYPVIHFINSKKFEQFYDEVI